MTRLETKFQRLERKYLVDEVTADRIRRDIEPWCVPDAHNPECSGRRRRPDQLGYEIGTLYLDSPGLAFYNANMRGDADRLKLRVRTYSRFSPALLEVKRRFSEVIDKTRVAVDRMRVADAVRGVSAPIDDGPESRRCLEEFGRLSAHAGAEPTLHLRYEREAYASSVDHYARVCFDRRICAQRVDEWALAPQPSGYREFDQFWRPDVANCCVVLELKCETAVPHWMTSLVRCHGLSRVSFSKYAIGIHVTGRFDGSRRRALRDARVMM